MNFDEKGIGALSFLMPPVTVSGFQNYQLKGFADATELKKGIYNASITVYYADKSTSIDASVEVMGGISTYLPIRVNQAGVMPIIFALSILLFPQMIATFLAKSSVGFIASAASAVESVLANQWVYGALYFGMVFLFTYFYTAITFEPHQIAKNLQKNGAFIPGVRPGGTTSEYLANIITRITLVGALFLGFLAILPLILRGITGITALTIGGTALLIVVSVVLDVVKKIDAQTSIREY